MTVADPTVEIASISGTGLATQLENLINSESVNEVGISCDAEMATLSKGMTTSDIKNSLLTMLAGVIAGDTTLAGLQGKTFTIIVDIIDEPTAEYTMTVA